MSRDQRTTELGRLEVATLGGGCFWCTEAVFSGLKGVVRVEPGYAGGVPANPTYAQVSTGITGHAEVVQITFDPNVISYSALLDVFFATHDPTTVDRQDADIGPQYRSIIFFHNDRQKIAAKNLIAELDGAGIYDTPIVTRVEPFQAFYRAESYHKEYFKRYPAQPYCRLVISPKMMKLRERYRDKLKP